MAITTHHRWLQGTHVPRGMTHKMLFHRILIRALEEKGCHCQITGKCGICISLETQTYLRMWMNGSQNCQGKKNPMVFIEGSFPKVVWQQGHFLVGQLFGLQETVGSAECILENAAGYRDPSLIFPTQVVTFSSVISESYFHRHGLSENNAAFQGWFHTAWSLLTSCTTYLCRSS